MTHTYTNTIPLKCDNCGKDVSNVYIIESECLCRDCYNKKYFSTFNQNDREDMKEVIKECLKEYFDGR